VRFAQSGRPEFVAEPGEAAEPALADPEWLISTSINGSSCSSIGISPSASTGADAAGFSGRGLGVPHSLAPASTEGAGGYRADSMKATAPAAPIAIPTPTIAAINHSNCRGGIGP